MSHQQLLRTGGSVLLAAAVLAVTARAAQPPYTRAMVELGDRIFHGRVASGLCSVCHGVAGRGTSAAPSLADSVWIHGDGSYEAILGMITEGVQHPGHRDIPMLAFGGMPLDSTQVRAVAAYVHSLGHPRTPRTP